MLPLSFLKRWYHQKLTQYALTLNKQGSVDGDSIEGHISPCCPIVAGNAVRVGGVANLQVVNGEYAGRVLFVVDHRNLCLDGNPLLIGHNLGVVPEPSNDRGRYA